MTSRLELTRRGAILWCGLEHSVQPPIVRGSMSKVGAFAVSLFIFAAVVNGILYGRGGAGAGAYAVVAVLCAFTAVCFIIGSISKSADKSDKEGDQ